MTRTAIFSSADIAGFLKLASGTPVMATMAAAFGSSVALAVSTVVPAGKLASEVMPIALSAAYDALYWVNISFDTVPGCSGFSISLKAA